MIARSAVSLCTLLVLLAGPASAQQQPPPSPKSAVAAAAAPVAVPANIEVLKDVAFRRCPFGPEEAERMIRSLRGFPLLDGVRGRPRADVPALARALSSLSAFADAAGPRLLSVDVNPMLVLPEGKGCFAADAVIEVAGEGH